MNPQVSRNTQDSSDVGAWIDKLKRELQAKNQRLLLSIEGSLQFNQLWLRALRSGFDSSLYLSDDAEQADARVSKPDHLLGQEAQLVLVDLDSGLHADALALAAGLVQAGGVLAIFSCGIKNWKVENDRYGIWQDEKRSIVPNFANYFFGQLAQSASTLQVLEGVNYPQIPDLELSPACCFIDGKTAEQQQLIDQTITLLQSRQTSIITITAARGRGKSTCLGFIGEELQRQFGLTSVVTASSRKSAEIVLRHNNRLEFFAPDHLLIDPIEADVLLVDEAARIPYSILRQLTQQFKKVVMATTIDGYEGTGQGFLLRFVKRWNQAQLTRFDIEDSIRWGEKDNLEDWFNRVFMLDSKSDSQTEESETDQRIDYRSFDVDQLQQSGLLESTYRLMMSAHYRSRPSDLRQIMENPDLHFLLAVQCKRVIGVAILNHEGGLDKQLSREIYFGRRRPKGHLMAQMITAQASVEGFSCYKGLRIIRIAVDQPHRRQGIGRELFRLAQDHAEKQQYDYLGACFAIDPAMSGFWKSCSLPLLHVGFGEGKSSGSHTALVAKPLNLELENIFKSLLSHLNNKLPFWFIQFLSRLDVESVISILSLSRYQCSFSLLEKSEIDAFSQGFKPLESSLVSLQRLAIQAISDARISDQDHHLLVRKVIQNWSWQEVAGELRGEPGMSGRKQIESRLRMVFNDLT